MGKCEESLLLTRRNDCISTKYIAEYSIPQTDDVYLLNHRFNLPMAILSPVPWLTPRSSMGGDIGVLIGVAILGPDTRSSSGDENSMSSIP